MEFQVTFSGNVILTEQAQMASKKPPFRKYCMVKAYPVGVFFVDELIPAANGSVLQVQGTIEARDKGVNLRLTSASLDGRCVYERAERFERDTQENLDRASLDGHGSLSL